MSAIQTFVKYIKLTNIKVCIAQRGTTKDPQKVQRRIKGEQQQDQKQTTEGHQKDHRNTTKL